MANYKILEVNLSTRTDTVAKDSEGVLNGSDFSRTEETFLVAHVLFVDLNSGTQGEVVHDLQSIAKKEVNSRGKTTAVTTTPLQFTTPESLEAEVVNAVESQIKSDNFNYQYNSHISSILSKANVSTAVYKRYTAPGV